MKKIIYSILLVLMLTALFCGCTQTMDTGVQVCAHVNQEVVGVVTATCSTAGYTGDTKCLDCNAVIQTGTEIAVLEHKVVTEGAVSATCLTAGKTGVGICEVCKVVVHEDSDVPPTGHTETTVNAVEATCTSTGYSGDVVCGVCNAEIRTGEEVDKTEHEIVLTNFKDATCASGGYTGDEVCKNCDVVISKGTTTTASHNEVVRGYKAPTCTTEGILGETYCADCGKVLSAEQVIPKTAHTVVVKNKKSATCTSTGYSGDEYCSVCNTKLSTGTTIAKSEHNPTTKNAVAATCTKDGYTGDVYCSYCKMSISTGSVISARGEHGGLSWINHIPATYDKGGYSGDHQCMDCGICVQVGHDTDPLPRLPEYECNADGETLIFNQINEQRAIHGLPALQLDTFLHTAAYNRVREYIYSYIQGNADVTPHQRPDGSPFTVAIQELGIAYSREAENIGGHSNFGGIVPGWMTSTQGHREAVLGTDWTHMSVCVVEYENTYYSVVLFHNGNDIPFIKIEDIVKQPIVTEP